MMKTDKTKIYGYVEPSHTLARCLDFSLASFLLLLASPLFLITSIAIKILDNGPVFYTQPRMGYQKRIFTIYKFRTLIPDADKIIGARVLSSRKPNLVTPIGKFLRNTRLDELPQLINIMKGDMTFFGPRPQRPEIVERYGRQIKNYDKRFNVRPGLIGFPQLFLPHSAPKRIQSRIDNMYLKFTQNYVWGLFLVGFTIYSVLKKFVVLSWNRLIHFIREKVLGKYSEKRAYERKRPKEGAYVIFSGANSPDSQDTQRYDLVDINEEALLIRAPGKLDLKNPCTMKIVTNFKTNGKLKRKTIICEGILHHKREGKNCHEYIIFFRPLSPLNFYLAHQYLLRKSLAYG